MGAALNTDGAPSRRLSSWSFALITLCGQTMAHWPHWMQRSDPRPGLPRRYCASVLASAGRIRAVHGKRADGERVAAHPGSEASRYARTPAPCPGRESTHVVARAFSGTRTSCRFATALSIAAKFFSTIAFPLFRVRLFRRALDRFDGLITRHHARQGKKHVCRIVLTREPSPRPDATPDASTTWT